MTRPERLVLNAEQRAFAIAELTVHAINFLDGEAEDPDGGCCPQCCAPCHALWQLWRSGELTETIAPFIDDGNDRWVWLNPDGSVDEAWLRNGWRAVVTHPDHESPVHAG